LREKKIRTRIKERKKRENEKKERKTSCEKMIPC
jgi:hypothetical protein